MNRFNIAAENRIDLELVSFSLLPDLPDKYNLTNTKYRKHSPGVDLSRVLDLFANWMTIVEMMMSTRIGGEKTKKNSYGVQPSSVLLLAASNSDNWVIDALFSVSCKEIPSPKIHERWSSTKV